MSEIVKVQRPIHGGDLGDQRPVLVYAEQRETLEFYREDQLPRWLVERLRNNPKVYVETTGPAHRRTFLKFAEWQEW